MNIFEDHTDASSLTGPSSSPLGASASSLRARKDPSITPRRFTRFFTPRASQSSPASASARALHELTASGLNQRDGDFAELSPRKRRKVIPVANDVEDERSLGIPSSPLRSSPCQRPLSPPTPAIRRFVPTFPSRIRREKTRITYTDPHHEIAGFYSRAEDRHNFQYPQLPFSLTACHSRS